ncbi:MAG: DMT family transporter [Gammaproteobacteria bacterium]|nr:DMT family transporter [Gammaproteobacteria bacterium]
MGSTVVLTTMAMIAFAANSVLCRLALGGDHIDAASFTAIRVMSGALLLVVIVAYRERGRIQRDADWRAALALFSYMVFFSFAYVSLGAGIGALILFGAVQLTMFAVALGRGESFSGVAWFGLALAFAGLVYLVSPGITAPEPLGAVLMAIAGISWGAYSLFGRSAADPTRATAWNFLLSVPLVIVVMGVYLNQLQLSPYGISLAIASGMVASGLGYVIWYAALPRLAATSAATVQLSVPAIAAIAGVLLLAEEPTMRLVLASIATLGGVALVLSQRSKA